MTSLFKMVFLIVCFVCVQACKNSDENREGEQGAARESGDEKVVPNGLPQTWRSSEREEKVRYYHTTPSDGNSALPFKGKVAIKKTVFAESNSILWKEGGSRVALKSLPYWKRLRIQALRFDQQKLYDAARQKNRLIKGETAAERKAWIKDYDSKNRREYKRLYDQERYILEQSVAPIPQSSAIIEFNQKLLQDEPIFEESDILIIEHLLPTPKKMSRNKLKLDDNYKKMLYAHKILASQFPNSVSRTELEHIYPFVFTQN